MDPPYLSKKARKDGRGAPEAPARYQKSLHNNPGRWARLAKYTSQKAAKLLAKAWTEEYPDLEFVAVRDAVYARDPKEGVTQEQAVTHAGASVRPPEVKKSPNPLDKEWEKLRYPEHYELSKLKTHPKWLSDFEELDLMEIHEELGLLL